jgi:hypothetical protein
MAEFGIKLQARQARGYWEQRVKQIDAEGFEIENGA